LFCGIILFLGAYIPAANYAAKLGGWSTPPGRFGTALEDTGGKVLMNNSIIMIIVGILILAWGCFNDDIIKILKKTKQS